MGSQRPRAVAASRMSALYRLDRKRALLFDSGARRFDPAARSWSDADSAVTGDAVDAVTAVTWMQRQSLSPIRVPIGVIGPREATPAQLAAAEAVGRGLGT